jgi:hypothetical protein
MRPSDSKRILVKATILFLLFGVEELAALAKHSEFLPESNPLHYISKSAKMDALHHSVDFILSPFYPAGRVVLPLPEFFAVLLDQFETITCRQIDPAASFQHRAPPATLL